MKSMFFIIPLMIIATLLYIYQSDKVNKDVQVNHQEMRAERAKFDADFDRRWGDKTASEIAENNAIITKEQAKLESLHLEQEEVNKQRDKATEKLKNRLSNELESHNSNASIYDELNK